MKGNGHIKYRQAEHVTGSNIDEAMIITSADEDKFYGMNKIASIVWNLLEDPISEEEVVKYLLGQFDVEQQQCENEVKLFFEEMQQAAIISKVV